MMVKITLDFPNIDVAIVALGKLAEHKTVVAAAAMEPKVVKDPKAGRKARADRGKKRGPYTDNAAAPEKAPVEADKAQPPGVVIAPDAAAPIAGAATARAGGTNAEVTDTSKAAERAANSTSTPTAPVPSSGVPTQADAQAALEKLFAKKKIEGAQEAMSRFGVKRLRDMKPEHYAEFIALCNKECE